MLFLCFLLMMKLHTSYLSFLCFFAVKVISKRSPIAFLNETSPILRTAPMTRNITGTALDRALITALPSSSSCGGCRFGFDIADAPWTIPPVTLLVLIDNATNITSISTIQDQLSTYETDVSIGSQPGFEEKAHLTHPTLYDIYHGFYKYTTISENTAVLNATSSSLSPLCRTTTISYTNVFAVPLVEGLEEDGLALSAFNSFYPTVGNDCTTVRQAFIKVPFILARVSALTITSTLFSSLARSSAVYPSPSAKPQNPVVLATTPIRNENDFENSDNASPKRITYQVSQPKTDPPPLLTPVQTLVPKPQPSGLKEHSIQYEAAAPGNVEPDFPSPTPKFPIQLNSDDSNSPDLNSPSNAVLTNPGRVKLKIFDQTVATLLGRPDPVSPPNTHPDPGHPLEQPASRPVISGASKTITVNRFSQFVIDGKTLYPGGSAIKVDGTPVSLAPLASHVVIGDSTILLATPQHSRLPCLTLDGSIITANELSQFLIDKQTLRPGGPEITVSGTPISLGPSATHVVIAGSTVKLARSPSPVLTLPGSIITPDSESQYLIGGKTLIPGSSISVSGTLISLAPFASEVVIGGSTFQLTALSVPISIAGGQTIAANSASQFIFDGQTLGAGSPAIIVSGTPISLPSSASNAEFGGSILPFPTPPITLHALTFGGKPVFPNSASEYIIGSQTIIPGAPAVTVSGTPISLAPSASKIVVGSITAALIDSANPLPLLTIYGTTIFPNSASEYIIGSQTLIPGSSGIRILGTPISLAPSASYIVVGGITAALINSAAPLPPLTIDGTTIIPNSDSEYVIGSQTLIPGASGIRISGTPISLAPSASKIVIGSTTATLTGSANPLPPLTIDGTTLFPNSASEYLIGSQTLIPGSSGIRISGTLISLAPSASYIVIGGITAALISSATPLPPLTIDGTTILPNSASEYIMGSQTLIPGASAITISGTRISLAPFASALIVDSKTTPLKTSLTTDAALPLITIVNSVITPNAASQYIIAGQTLVPGGPAITISGTPISLAPQASAVIVGTSSEGLGRVILAGAVATAPASVNGPASATGPAGLRNVATRLDGQWWVVAILTFGLGLWGWL